MTMVERRVRTLRVRAPDEDRARHLGVVVEDALRTATLPGTSGGRLVCIRRLDLRCVPAGAAPATVALAVEATVHRIAASAVHGDRPDADGASVVYFDDDAQPLLAMARRVAQGHDMSEWFWPIVLRGWSPVASPEATISMLLDRAFDTSAGVVTAARLIATLAQLDALDLVLGPLTESRATSLIVASGLAGLNPRATSQLEIVLQPTPNAANVLSQWLARWGGRPSDPRAIWLAAMLVIAERPTRAATSALEGIVGALLTAVAGRLREVQARQDWAAPDQASLDDLNGGVQGEPRWWEWVRGKRENGNQRHPEERSDEGSLSLGSLRIERDPALTSFAQDDRLRAPDTQRWDEPRPTAFAGFLFLVPLLSRIGIALLLEQRPTLAEGDWPERLLRRIGGRLGVPMHDAILDWLTRDAPIRPDERLVTATTIRAMRDRARRDAGRPLARLIRRDGIIVVTRTHVDVLMHHSQVDVAIRRAGLDIDPGWVPWLGRVVQFHYVDLLPPVDGAA